MSNLRPNQASAKKSILDFARSLVPNFILKQLSMVLTPCCQISASAVVTCGSGPGLYNVAITLSEGVNFAGHLALAAVPGRSMEVPYVDNSTLINIPDARLDGSVPSITLEIITFINNPITTADLGGNTSRTVVGYVITEIPVTLPIC